MDPVAFDQFIRNKGVRLVHWRALKCPVGLLDPSDVRRVHADHVGCSNGYLYRAIGRVTCLFLSNQTQLVKIDPGFVDGSTVAVSLPRFYDTNETERVIVHPMDRFYLEEDYITTATHELYKRRSDGRPDRPGFPVQKVHHLVDANGVWYDGASFDIVAGDIQWKKDQGPAEGTVYSVFYEYKPYWYVERLVHEVRVIPVADYIDTTKISMERHAYGAVLCREFVHRDQKPDADAPASNRQQLPPDVVTEFGER